MLQYLRAQSPMYKTGAALAVFLCGMFIVSGAFAWYLSGRILPRTWIGSVAVGGLTRDQAAVRIQEALDALDTRGIVLSVEGSSEIIVPDSIALDLNVSDAIDTVFRYGHEDALIPRMGQSIAALVSQRHVEAPVRFDESALRLQIAGVANAMSSARRDIRLTVVSGKVDLLTDTRPGRVIDQQEGFSAITESLRGLRNETIALQLHDDAPVADPEKAKSAVGVAQKMISRPLLLQYEDSQFTINRDRLGSWITSEYDGDGLKPGLNRDAIGTYVTTVAHALNIESQPPQITTHDGRVTSFLPPKVGRSVQEDKLIAMISDSVFARTAADKTGDTLAVPIKTTKMDLIGLDAQSGITERIGKATTPFTGSPKNRISNIKNGVKFITGTIVQPGSEFSTLGTLGSVDNTTGYLPELVIKGDRTQPEFGGGLCQVSTTLFRAVMNAGLPVTARQNHSYRVSYYEKDGNGVKIGPGLDATVYEPNPDFKFRNDTAQPILIIGYVIGDKLTFELYGTGDGRTSTIDGPHLLSETPAGETKYIPTATLPAGQKKQVETAHAGGSAIATYSITYPDGHTDKQVFRSKYKPWPAQFLVGTNTGCATSAQCAQLFPELFATPFPTPSPVSH